MKYLQMKYIKISIVLFVSLFFAMSAFAQVDQRISNNEFYIESLRLTKLAQETYEIGDYEASAGFAHEAFLFAQLSDEYVAEQLIIEAKRLMDLADRNNVVARFPINYNEGKEYYETAVAAQGEEEWNDAIEAASSSIEIFAALTGGTPVAARPPQNQGQTTQNQNQTQTTDSNNRQYTVRTWRVERDCLWNIAGYSWVYGDPWRWRELYEANKSRMPDPNNPDLIHPGMVLDIPR
ncbi:MAG: LysM peptidoglycan-binding domain-containing protein [Treponema sp.]|nr:LysM peptidoglycan-binding domain-containing protein [Treponema sp.]